MTATVVLGAQWGDEMIRNPSRNKQGSEVQISSSRRRANCISTFSNSVLQANPKKGKGKLTDVLAQGVTLCCRAAGGNNAGHTIVVKGTKYGFHILPSGLINPKCRNLIGSGCVVHIPSLFSELDELESKGLKTSGRIFVAEAAHVVFDLHQTIDGLEEAALGKAKVGTTGKGIGPCYSTKMARSGVRVGELAFDKKKTDSKLRSLAQSAKARYGDLFKYDVDSEISRIDALREKLQPLVIDAVRVIAKAQADGEKILIEGANALMLDIDYGTYPYVTSSSTGLGGCFTGLGGLKRKNVTKVVGVVKAYTTRVGSGPFPTEQLTESGEENEIGQKLQSIGAEFGATTGRRRRCGWLDAVLLKYSATINDYDCINLSKLDVLDTFPEIKVAVAYHLVNPQGQRAEKLDSFPADIGLLDGTSARGRVEVEYKTFEGWNTSIAGATKWDDLPVKAKEYVQWVERFIGVPIEYIGTGTGREDMIVR